MRGFDIERDHRRVVNDSAAVHDLDQRAVILVSDRAWREIGGWEGLVCPRHQVAFGLKVHSAAVEDELPGCIKVAGARAKGRELQFLRKVQPQRTGGIGITGVSEDVPDGLVAFCQLATIQWQGDRPILKADRPGAHELHRSNQARI